MNVLQSWKSLHNQIAELRELLADARTSNEQIADKLSKETAENDELREQMEERDKETAYLISQKIRTIEALRCEVDAKKKILSDTFSVFDSFYSRLKAGYKHGHDDAA